MLYSRRRSTKSWKRAGTWRIAISSFARRPFAKCASEAVGELDGSLGHGSRRRTFFCGCAGLYRYSLVRLLDANRQQADEPMAEVLGLQWTTLAGSRDARPSPRPGSRANPWTRKRRLR